MDQLQQLVETLRVLAQTNEPNRVVSIEKTINEYLNDKAGIVRAGSGDQATALLFLPFEELVIELF